LEALSEGRHQGTLFPVLLDDLVPDDHVCRVIDAFVNGLKMTALGFERAEAADTGRPGYDPRDLLKLYLYGYLNQIRSSRRLEAECRRNVELMWLLGRVHPDHKSIAEFRRLHRDAVTAAGAELIRFARSCGLIRGEWIAIDGSKVRAVASIDSARERLALQRYLDSIEKADEEQQASIDPSAVQTALEKLKQHPEPEAGFMLMRQTSLPAYNFQTAVDAEHALIVAHAVVLDASDIRCLKPMAEAAKKALEIDSFQVVADAGYSNGEQAAAGMMPYVPVMRTVKNQGDGTLFGREDFRYEPNDQLRHPAAHGNWSLHAEFTEMTTLPRPHFQGPLGIRACHPTESVAVSGQRMRVDKAASQEDSRQDQVQSMILNRLCNTIR
jgi:transposase